MSERAESRSTGQSTASKSERRLAAKLAAQKAAEAKRRRQSMLGALAGLAVVAVIVAAFLAFGGGDDEPAEQAAGTPSAGASSAPPDAPAAGPQLPPGADPALGTKPAVTKGSGELKKLTVTPLIKGTGPATKAGQQITVNYVGAFYKTGEEFDASWKTGQPFTFPVGAGEVIPGWDQGLVGVNVGSRVQLDIPADLAYGENASGGRPAGPLRFVVDVLAAQ